MILLLATDHDETAQAFSAWLTAHGMAHAITQNLAEVRLNVLINRQGTADVDLVHRSSGAPVTGILNRGFFWSPDGNAFTQSEDLAAWWAALSLFRGKVVNRPTPAGLLPPACWVDVSVPEGIERQLADRSPTLPSNLVAHRHDPGTQIFLGRSASGDGAQFEHPELVTVFNPSTLRHAMIVGNRAFDLADAKAPAQICQNEFFAEAAPEPLFAHVVLTDSGSRSRVLQINHLPLLAYFSHLEPAVFSALLSALHP